MKKSIFNPLMRVLIMVVGILVIGGCADIPSTGPELPELTAEFRFLNAAYDEGPLEVLVDGNSIGTIAYKSSLPHTRFFAGSRVVTLSTHDTLRIAMATYRRGTMIILPKDGDVRGYLRLIERRTFDKVDADTGMVRLANATGLADDLDLTIFNADTSVSINESLASEAETGYIRLPIGTYQIQAMSPTDTTQAILATTSITVTKNRKTSILVGADVTSLSFVNLEDN